MSVRSAAFAEERAQQLAALGLAHAGPDRELVVQAWVLTQVVERAERAAVVAEGAEHHAGDPGRPGCVVVRQAPDPGVPITSGTMSVLVACPAN